MYIYVCVICVYIYIYIHVYRALIDLVLFVTAVRFFVGLCALLVCHYVQIMCAVTNIYITTSIVQSKTQKSFSESQTFPGTGCTPSSPY